MPTWRLRFIFQASSVPERVENTGSSWSLVQSRGEITEFPSSGVFSILTDLCVYGLLKEAVSGALRRNMGAIKH